MQFTISVERAKGRMLYCYPIKFYVHIYNQWSSKSANGNEPAITTKVQPLQSIRSGQSDLTKRIEKTVLFMDILHIAQVNIIYIHAPKIILKLENVIASVMAFLTVTSLKNDQMIKITILYLNFVSVDMWFDRQITSSKEKCWRFGKNE